MAGFVKGKLDTAHDPTWCPGCGDFAIWMALKNVILDLQIEPHNVLIVYGIGCSGNMTNYVSTYGWHSLHGRAVPTAVGAKLMNKNLTVIVVAGDGDSLGEGMGHFIHAMRGNADITYIIHDNKVYGLTIGQAAPTAIKGYKSKSTPEGIIEINANALSLAVATGCGFVSKGFSGRIPHLQNLIKQAILHKGFSLVDVYQPCVTFNKVNNFPFYNERIYDLQQEGHDVHDRSKAFEKALEWGDRIPIGIFYQDDRPSYETYLPQEEGEPIVKRPMKVRDLTYLKKEFM
ncbi:2-oxoacid ferredoxin oxidoreductase [Candidatus Peregrinibacteria bacterium]|nr:2-oxoacid ferredoxin oxidoreductase [Candidatus Peregrinibacteria bacterium]